MCGGRRLRHLWRGLAFADNARATFVIKFLRYCVTTGKRDALYYYIIYGWYDLLEKPDDSHLVGAMKFLPRSRSPYLLSHT